MINRDDCEDYCQFQHLTVTILNNNNVELGKGSGLSTEDDHVRRVCMDFKDGSDKKVFTKISRNKETVQI